MAAENDMPLEALADSSRQRQAGNFDEFSAYPPIADYAFLSDCEVTALVAPSGSVEWMCLPKMDGPSVFGSMLDRDAGWFRFGPDDVSVPSDRRYLPGTMVLETSWDCGEGWLVVRECLVMGPWQHDHPDGSTHIRPPTDRRLVWTAHHWQHWLSHGRFPDHRWRGHLARSALTLKGLTFAPTGAIAAAATTSLPETPGGERNWDYRYTWMRDATFALWGLYTLGFEWEANDYVAFLRDLVERDRGDLQIVYGIDGRRELDEHVLDHLNGYQGARPVRIGNGAYQQAQHDVWGVILDSIYLHTKSRDRLDDRTWKMARQQVERALERWREPDRGIWEVRGEPKHFTSSKMMCWVAVDRGARLAILREDKDLVRTWRKAADEIRADICANALDDRGVFCQHYETTALDASLLLMPLLRFLPPEDSRIRATMLAIADELTQDGLVLRYQVDETDDGLSGEEGTFTICSFWLVSALTEIGEHQRARDICEKVLSYASPLLLYGEEIDPRSGRQLGNFPQAFTHLALINAVMHVIRKEQAAHRRAMAREVPEREE